MCKGKNFIDFPIGNTYKTNKQAGGNVKHLRSFPKLSTIILLLSYLFFILNLNMMNIISC